MKNQEIASLFSRIADILDFKGENSFRVNAYRRGALILSDLTEDVEALVEEGRLTEIPGIGEGMARNIEEYLGTGRMSKYEEVRKGVPEDLIALLGVQGMGPKTLALAHRELGIKSLNDLRMVMDSGELAALRGMGEKKVANLKKGLEHFLASRERISLGVAYPLVLEIIEALQTKVKVQKVCPAGSLRRMRETVGDIDILATGRNGAGIISAFASLPMVTQVLAAGETKGSCIVEGGTQVDLRVVEPGSYGAALQYFTGSKAHNVKLREMARAKGLKVNEYGVFRGKKKIAGKAEAEVYKTLGLPLIPPELREDRGEVEMAMEGKLPSLVENKDILGDLHVHTKWSDGHHSVEEMARAAKERGYKYLGIAEHTPSAAYAGGISEAELKKEWGEIAGVQKRLKGIRILRSAEVDIRADGSLDYSDEILKELDFGVASIHSGFKKRVTERILKAMQNPYVDAIGHPTGRLISRREGYEVDLEAVFKAAAATETALEINAYDDRLDLNDVHVKRAKEAGVKITINTDAHHIDQLWMMELGVGTARRGWLAKGDVLNCLPPERLRKKSRKKV
jgi:DNA polymerase (family 10)